MAQLIAFEVARRTGSALDHADAAHELRTPLAAIKLQAQLLARAKTDEDRAKYAVDAYGNDRNQYVQGLGDATMAAMNSRLGGLQTQANVAAGRVNAMQNQNAGGALASALGPIAQFAGSYFGSGS